MKVSEQYSYEIKKILNDIDQLKHGKIHELQNATCYPSISRLGEQLEIEINELIYALDNQLPGKVQVVNSGNQIWLTVLSKRLTFAWKMTATFQHWEWH